MLTRQAGRYALTPSAATFLVRGRPAYAGDLVLGRTGPALLTADFGVASCDACLPGQITDSLALAQNGAPITSQMKTF
ncbi:MAG: hypothetical protein M5U01_23760 [Ardenticatenaceae bacterium]|nr:hypothetical protein [Ardenticatenaceae bacterium]